MSGCHDGSCLFWGNYISLLLYMEKMLEIYVKSSLFKEITSILVLKLLVLWVIWYVFFSTSAVPIDVMQHF